MAMRRWAMALGAVLLLPVAAHANGAMGLALSIFHWPIWLVYVAATIVFEAWWIGRALKKPFGAAIFLSASANAVTLVLGFLFSGVFGYMLYGALGSHFSPNPLGQTILLLPIGNLISALIETLFWETSRDLAKRLWQANLAAHRHVFRSTFAAHLLGVPLALAILLIPDRPYPGLEGQAAWRRSKVVGDGGHYQGMVDGALQEVIAETGRIPLAHDLPDLMERLRPRFRRFGDAPDLWAAGYIPHFERFDTGERRRNPIEWNAALAGKRVDALPEKVWLLRWRLDGGTIPGVAGLILDRGDLVEVSGVKRAQDLPLLGYGPGR